MGATDWRRLAAEGDFAGAREAWREQWTRREDDLAALWELAEIEERWGDWLLSAEEAGSTGHFHAALKALIPTGSIFTQREENDQRMEAFTRTFEKLQSVDSYWKVRDGEAGRPHPNSQPRPERPKPVEERKDAAVEMHETRPTEQPELIRLFLSSGHWGFSSLAFQFREAGKALAARYPDAARLAFGWSIYYFEAYNREWTAHLPASRWESDGGLEMIEVEEMTSALAPDGGESPPDWVEQLLAGRPAAALKSLAGDRPAPEFEVLGKLLDSCAAANQKSVGNDAQHEP